MIYKNRLVIGAKNFKRVREEEAVSSIPLVSFGGEVGEREVR